MHEAGAKRGEIKWTSHSWFWFNLWLVEKVARDFLANHITFHKCFDRWLYLHPLEWVLQPWPLLFVEDEDSFHRHRSLHCKEYRRTRWNGRSYEVEQQPRIPKTAKIASNWLSCHPRVKTNGSTPMVMSRGYCCFRSNLSLSHYSFPLTKHKIPCWIMKKKSFIREHHAQ